MSASNAKLQRAMRNGRITSVELVDFFLARIPLVVKDNIDTAEMPTTAGTPVLEHFRPAQDAFQVRRLHAAGAIIIAKANLADLARAEMPPSLRCFLSSRPCALPAVRAGATPVLLLQAHRTPGMDKAPGQTWGFGGGARGGS